SDAAPEPSKLAPTLLLSQEGRGEQQHEQEQKMIGALRDVIHPHFEDGRESLPPTSLAPVDFEECRFELDGSKELRSARKYRRIPIISHRDQCIMIRHGMVDDGV